MWKVKFCVKFPKICAPEIRFLTLYENSAIFIFFKVDISSVPPAALYSFVESRIGYQISSVTFGTYKYVR